MQEFLHSATNFYGMAETPQAAESLVRLENLSPEDQERMLKSIMSRQARLSIRIAAVFIALLIGIPIFNWQFPVAAARSTFGFTGAWFLLGIMFFPITWVLSGYFVKKSDQLEARVQSEVTAK